MERGQGSGWAGDDQREKSTLPAAGGTASVGGWQGRREKGREGLTEGVREGWREEGLGGQEPAEAGVSSCPAPE